MDLGLCFYSASTLHWTTWRCHRSSSSFVCKRRSNSVPHP